MVFIQKGMIKHEYYDFEHAGNLARSLGYNEYICDNNACSKHGTGLYCNGGLLCPLAWLNSSGEYEKETTSRGRNLMYNVSFYESIIGKELC